MARAVLIALLSIGWAAAAFADAGWSHYGGDEGGLRYSAAAQITPENVDDLIPVWTYSTGDLARRDAKTMRRTSMQVTPISRRRQAPRLLKLQRSDRARSGYRERALAVRSKNPDREDLSGEQVQLSWRRYMA